MNWPQLLDTLRERGWTQTLLSERLKISQPTISELQTGKTKDPKHSTGEALRVLFESGEVPATDKAAA